MKMLLLSIGVLLASLGFAALGLSQVQHWRTVRRDLGAQPPRLLRPAGWILIGASSVPPLLSDGIAFGTLLWTGLLSVAAICVVAINVWRTKIL